MILPNFKRNRYTDLGMDVLKSLTKNQLENGTLYDKVDHSNTPDDHYAHTFFALAAYLSYRCQNAYEEKALEYFSNIPNKKRGHHEFNLLACLLIREILTQGRLASPPQSSCFDLLTDYIKKAPFEAGENTAHGNNWVAIQALDLLLRYHQFKVPDDLQRANHLIDHYVLRWQLPDGIFYDTPRSPNAKYIKTPLTYHAKFCMVLSLYAQISNRCDVYRAVLRGLDALSKLVSPNGEGFYFGRTNNAIFGYVSALYAYETMIRYLLSSKERDKITADRVIIYRQTADALFSYLKDMQEPEGSLRLTPGSIGLRKAGWDAYMHHTVYNAYASAILLMTPYTQVLKKDYPSDKRTFVYFLENSGFLAVKHERNFLVMNTRGQGVDPRYIGMIPLIWYVEGVDLLPSPPTHKGDFKIGFIPVIISEDRRYVPATWRNINVIKNEYGVTVFSEGVLTEFPNPLNNRTEGLFQRLKSSTTVYNFSRKIGIIQIVKLARAWNKWLYPHIVPLKLYRGVVISNNGEEMFIVDTLKATRKIGKLRIIPPSLLISTKSISNLSAHDRELLIQLRNVELNIKFEILLPEIDNFDQASQLDTSKGPATLLTPSEVFLSNLEDSFHSVTWLKVYKRSQEPNCQIAVKKNRILIYEDSTLVLSINTVNRTIEVNTEKVLEGMGDLDSNKNY